MIYCCFKDRTFIKAFFLAQALLLPPGGSMWHSGFLKDQSTVQLIRSVEAEGLASFEKVKEPLFKKRGFASV